MNIYLFTFLQYTFLLCIPIRDILLLFVLLLFVLLFMKFYQLFKLKWIPGQFSIWFPRVPQSSILALPLFSLYMLPLSQIMRKNQIAYHSYADDDTQIYLALSPNDYSPIDSLCQCIDEINTWMCQKFIQLKKEKTEVIAFGNKDEVIKVNAYLDSRGQTTKNQVKNLGVILETDLSFSSHVKTVIKSG